MRQPGARRHPTSTVVALALSLALHGGLLTLALIHYTSAAGDQDPHLLLSRGWASDLDGASDAAPAVDHPAVTFIDLPRPPADALSVPDSSGQAPGSLDLTLATPSATGLSPSEGTSDPEPLPTLAADRSAPVNLNTPPGSGQADGPQPAATQSMTSASSGPPQGVPDALPVANPHNRIPPYPTEARRRGWRGTVTLQLQIDPTGRVSQATLLRSCGHDLLDRAALDTALTWQFSPARANGRPIPILVTRDINFIPPSR